MKSNKTKKIALKVTARIAIGLLVVFVALAIIVKFSIERDLVEREQDKLTLLATENASIARGFMESMLNKQTVLVNLISNIDQMDDSQKIDTLSRVISDTKKEESNALSFFYAVEPNYIMEGSTNNYAIFATDKETKSEANISPYISPELYESVKESKQMMVVDPFEKTIDGTPYMVITVLLPILDEQGEFLGVVGTDIDATLLNNAEYNHGGFKTFTTQIICGHQTVITNSTNPDMIGKKYEEVSESTNTQKILDTAKDAESLSFVDTNIDGEKYYKSYIPFYLEGSSVVWLSGTSIKKAEFDAQIVKQVAFIVIWLIVGFIVLIGLAYFRLKASLHPIQKLERSVKELSQGNLHYALDYTSDDELGSLADSLRESTTTLFAYVTDIDRVMSEMAGRNFELEPSQPFIGDFTNIELSIDKFLQTMSAILLQIRNAAEQVSAGASQVSDGAQALAQSATEQASSIVVLSTEITEITDNVKGNEQNANQANQLAGVVGEKIHTSNEQMMEMIEAISDISQASEKIGNIIQTIEDIAFQTNILALNAAVEAARAGTAGKGFAVVADEVRNLAIKSSEAAKQTGELIAESVNTVQKGVRIAHNTEASLKEVVIGAGEITKLIAEISNASSRQTESLAQIIMGIDQISSVVQMNSATSEESAAASEELSSQADMMKTLISQFRISK